MDIWWLDNRVYLFATLFLTTFCLLQVKRARMSRSEIGADYLRSHTVTTSFLETPLPAGLSLPSTTGRDGLATHRNG
jgi:hypothetical protein